MKKTILSLIVVMTPLIARSNTYDPPTISRGDANLIRKTAVDYVQTLGRYLEMIGSSYMESSQKAKIIQTEILEVVDKDAVFTNDLDPTGKTPGNFTVTDYCRNISIFYHDTLGVSIRFEEINSVEDIYYNEAEKIFFCKVKATRMLSGNYFDNGTSIANNNTRDLDFFVNVVRQQEAISFRIISMQDHRAMSGLRKVTIKDDTKSIFSTIEMDAIQKELAQHKIDLEIWKSKTEAAERDARAARREAELARRELQLKGEELQNANQRAENEKQARELAERQAIVAKKEKEALHTMAQRNRIVLNLGGGVGFLTVSDEEQKAYNINKSTLRNYHLTGNLNYRLGSVEKLKRANGGTSLSVFYTRDYFGELATTFFLNTVDTKREVIEKSTTSEFQGGLIFWQIVRLSAGVGSVSYKTQVTQNNVPAELRAQTNYTVYTMGFITPSLKNTLLFYANIRIFQIRNPIADRGDYFRGNLEIGLKLQIQ